MKHKITKPKRHGDLMLIPVEKIPIGAKKIKGLTLALGEVTGHHHTIKGKAQLFMMDKQKYFTVFEKSILTHQEHNTIPLEKGSYKLNLEQEFDPFLETIRRVRD